MATSLSIGKIIKAQLNDIIPDKVFPLIAPAKTQYPFIIYRRSGISVYGSKDGIYEDGPTVEIIVASLSYEDSINLAEKIRIALENKQGTVNGIRITGIDLIGADESYLSDAYIQKLTFQIKTSIN